MSFPNRKAYPLHTLGRPLYDFWMAFGRHSDDVSTVFETLLDDCLITFRRLLDNFWTNDFWATFGKTFGRLWSAFGRFGGRFGARFEELFTDFMDEPKDNCKNHKAGPPHV